MGMYNQFASDENLESEGVWIDYGDFRVKVARNGGKNKAYQKYAEVKLKPVRRAIETGSLSRERADPLLMDIYAQTVVKAWEVKEGKGEDASWKPGIEAPDGSVMPFTKENVIKTFEALPNLFADIQTMSESMANFRVEEVEADGKNS